MHNWHVLLALFIFSCLCCVGWAGDHHLTLFGGDIHLRGELAEGGCSISSGSRDMHINMGNYTTLVFDGVGSLATKNVPFSIRLSECKPELAEYAMVTFAGKTVSDSPDAFLVTVGDETSAGIAGDEKKSGLGLVIFDPNGNQIMPGKAFLTRDYFNRHDIELHFLARYRETSQQIHPGPLNSEVWFSVSYP